jgi:hypothetical protein
VTLPAWGHPAGDPAGLQISGPGRDVVPGNPARAEREDPEAVPKRKAEESNEKKTKKKKKKKIGRGERARES